MSHVNHRSAYFLTLLEKKKKHNPRYLFETVAKLTKKESFKPRSVQATQQ